MIVANNFSPSSHSRAQSGEAMLKNELAHFEVCPMCDQAVDRRDIYAVMHHLPVGHQPIPVH